MNPIEILILKSLRKAYQKLFVPAPQPYDRGITDPDEASKVIYDLLASGKPCMIARYGSTELSAIANYLAVSDLRHSIWRYIKGEQQQWWWNPNIMQQMQRWSGFFPATEENLNRFGRMMLEDAKEVDVLGCWVDNEKLMLPYMSPALQKLHLHVLEPFWSCNPWSRILRGKRIVVVHPFAATIKAQYQNSRRNLFDNQDVLPEFGSLRTVKAVQSLGGGKGEFKDWFEALEWMKKEIDREDYDICLIGCGAYGFPLAAHVKSTGKQAVHLGGALQLLFGIRGKRWEDPNYGVRQWGIAQGLYSNLMNEYWVRPSENEKTNNAQEVEGGCYW